MTDDMLWLLRMTKKNLPKVIWLQSVEEIQTYGQFYTNAPKERKKEGEEDLEFAPIDRRPRSCAGAPVKIKSFHSTFLENQSFLPAEISAGLRMARFTTFGSFERKPLSFRKSLIKRLNFYRSVRNFFVYLTSINSQLDLPRFSWRMA